MVWGLQYLALCVGWEQEGFPGMFAGLSKQAMVTRTIIWVAVKDLKSSYHHLYIC